MSRKRSKRLTLTRFLGLILVPLFFTSAFIMFYFNFNVFSTADLTYKYIPQIIYKSAITRNPTISHVSEDITTIPPTNSPTTPVVLPSNTETTEISKKSELTDLTLEEVNNVSNVIYVTPRRINYSKITLNPNCLVNKHMTPWTPEKYSHNNTQIIVFENYNYIFFDKKNIIFEIFDYMSGIKLKKRSIKNKYEINKLIQLKFMVYNTTKRKYLLNRYINLTCINYIWVKLQGKVMKLFPVKLVRNVKGDFWDIVVQFKLYYLGVYKLFLYIDQDDHKYNDEPFLIEIISPQNITNYIVKYNCVYSYDFGVWMRPDNITPSNIAYPMFTSLNTLNHYKGFLDEYNWVPYDCIGPKKYKYRNYNNSLNDKTVLKCLSNKWLYFNGDSQTRVIFFSFFDTFKFNLYYPKLKDVKQHHYIGLSNNQTNIHLSFNFQTYLLQEHFYDQFDKLISDSNETNTNMTILNIPKILDLTIPNYWLISVGIWHQFRKWRSVWNNSYTIQIYNETFYKLIDYLYVLKNSNNTKIRNDFMRCKIILGTSTPNRRADQRDRNVNYGFNQVLYEIYNKYKNDLPFYDILDFYAVTTPRLFDATSDFLHFHGKVSYTLGNIILNSICNEYS